MRVVAGELRGRRIESPRSEATRPTTDKVREAVFNSLNSMGETSGAVVVDLFAGTGALGIEALSRGAERCIFVELDRDALAVLRRNVDSLGLSDRAQVVAGDASAATIPADATLVMADPPYGFDRWQALLERIARSAPRALVVAESPTEVQPPEGWETVRSRRYGRTVTTFLRRATPATGAA